MIIRVLRYQGYLLAKFFKLNCIVFGNSSASKLCADSVNVWLVGKRNPSKRTNLCYSQIVLYKGKKIKGCDSEQLENILYYTKKTREGN